MSNKINFLSRHQTNNSQHPNQLGSARIQITLEMPQAKEHQGSPVKDATETPEAWKKITLKNHKDKCDASNNFNNSQLQETPRGFAIPKLRSAPKPEDYTGQQANIPVSPAASSSTHESIDQSSPYEKVKNRLRKIPTAPKD